MTTDKCAVSIAEGKDGGFAEQNHVNASLGFRACALVSLETTLTVNTMLLSHIVLFAQIYTVIGEINALLK